MNNIHEKCCDVARNMLLPRQVASIFADKSSHEFRTMELPEIVMRYARIVKGDLKKINFKNTSLSSEKDPVPESSTPLPPAALALATGLGSVAPVRKRRSRKSARFCRVLELNLSLKLKLKSR